ncbi:hypothetical protein [Nocardia sp. CY41]|uniref:hypothetical protein n=1 Tax=Nocardia sp. CY41 TaxID=2608686 RepID=UPI0013577493|nr:hypothetical protein [Nocardia sp. CY41]
MALSRRLTAVMVTTLSRVGSMAATSGQVSGAAAPTLGLSPKPMVTLVTIRSTVTSLPFPLDLEPLP